MGLVDLKNMQQEYRSWSQYMNDSTRKIHCSLGEFPVTVVFTRMLFKGEKLAIPNRINVSHDDPKIKEAFTKHVWKPIPYFPDWNQNVWIFKDEKDLSHFHMQFELRFFPDDSSLNRQLEEEERTLSASKQQLHHFDYPIKNLKNCLPVDITQDRVEAGNGDDEV